MTNQSYSAPIIQNKIVIQKILKIVQQKYRISSKELANRSKISQKHISEFKSSKVNLTDKSLWQLFLALEEIDPLARLDLGLSLGGCGKSDGKTDWQKFIEIISSEDLEEILIEIAKKAKPKSKSLDKN